MPTKVCLSPGRSGLNLRGEGQSNALRFRASGELGLRVQAILARSWFTSSSLHYCWHYDYDYECCTVLFCMFGSVHGLVGAW